MPLPASITDLSTTAGSNSPPGSESPATLDDYLRSHAAFIAQLRAVIGGAVNPLIPNNYQASASDNTLGKVLTVGAFGVGQSRPVLMTNANSFSGGGLYHCPSGIPNEPPNNGPGSSIYCSGDTTFGVQLACSYSNSFIYKRSVSSGVWGAWTQIATSDNSLGQAQTWQDLSGSRNPGTTYTNSTGRPIAIFVEGTASGGNTTTLANVGATSSIVTSRHAANGFFVTIPMIVPSGSTYSITPFTGGWASKVWWELR